MAKHTKVRAFERVCALCGSTFITGGSIMLLCSPECRVREAALAFAPSDECWNWPRSRNPQNGYGQLSAWRDGKRILLTAHRVAYSAFVGPLNGLQVLHRCDNRACFNPAHLFLGSQQDNMDDMHGKGRGMRSGWKSGDEHWMRKQPEKIRRGKDHHLVKDPSCMPRGTAHPAAKINDDDVRAIRASTETLAVLSVRYSMTQSTLSSIRRRRTWAHVA